MDWQKFSDSLTRPKAKNFQDQIEYKQQSECMISGINRVYDILSSKSSPRMRLLGH